MESIELTDDQDSTTHCVHGPLSWHSSMLEGGGEEQLSTIMRLDTVIQVTVLFLTPR